MEGLEIGFLREREFKRDLALTAPKFSGPKI